MTDTSEELKRKALAYHRIPQPGKLDVTSSKPFNTQEELTLAYSPGVAYPCLEIKDNPDAVYEYTSKGNTVAVITDGTAVLGLGNIGSLASIPVMEGKAILLKRFAGINGIPIAIAGHNNSEDFVHIVSTLHENYGAINLEDIKAPECFLIEEQLQSLPIPVFHDDQHGTAIISLAGLTNAAAIVGKTLEELRIVFTGAGAAGLASAALYVAAGIPRAHITFVDSEGVIYRNRSNGMNPYKERFAQDTDARTLADALQGADVFIGVSVPNILTEAMIQSMNRDPIIFALANPVPEIMPELAIQYGARIAATGRSDMPNQINNVLGFPGIFRGALDTRATRITTGMKLAASKALIQLTRQSIPQEVQTYLASVYPADAATGMFTSTNPMNERYIIPKPFDPRVVPAVAAAVADAAAAEGVAQRHTSDSSAV